MTTDLIESLRVESFAAMAVLNAEAQTERLTVNGYDSTPVRSMLIRQGVESMFYVQAGIRLTYQDDGVDE